MRRILHPPTWRVKGRGGFAAQFSRDH